MGRMREEKDEGSEGGIKVREEEGVREREAESERARRKRDDKKKKKMYTDTHTIKQPQKYTQSENLREIKEENSKPCRHIFAQHYNIPAFPFLHQEPFK